MTDGKGGSEEVEAWLLLPAEGEGHGDGPWPLLVDMHGGPHSPSLSPPRGRMRGLRRPASRFPLPASRFPLPASTAWRPRAGGFQRPHLLVPAALARLGGAGTERRGLGQLRPRVRAPPARPLGELDLPQYEAIIRTLQDEGIADDRLACAGKSYGGFLAAWAIGHCDLFRAAAVAAPIANIESHMGTSDTGYYVTPYAMAREPEEDHDRYYRLSPITACDNATAATLILQGENDGRCPRGQSEELFAHLIRCTDAPAELVVYP